MVCAIAAMPAVSQAAAAKVAFNIPATGLKAALVSFAIQAKVSISTGAAANCRPTGNPLVGRFNLSDGLTRLLAGTGCSFRIIDPQTIEILRAPPRAQPLHPPEARVSPPDTAPVLVNELVVTATKRTASAGKLPYSVSVISGETIEGADARGASEIALMSPAVTVTNLGPGRNKIFIRGLSDGPLTGRAQSMVSVQLDDVRLTYNAPDPDLRLVDVERVEILRGPQGSLYGAGSMGGVFRIVTKAPDLDQSAGWLSTSAATTQGGDASSVVEGMVNVPLIGGRLAVRAVAYKETDGGYIDDVGLALSNVNHGVRKGWRVQARARLTDNWRLDAGLTDQRNDSDDTQYAQGGLAPFTRSNQVREPHDNDFTQAFVSLDGRFEWGRLKWTSALVRHEIISRYDASRALPAITGGAVGAAALDDDNRIKSVIHELTLTSPETSKVDWLAGLFVARGEQDVRLLLSASPSGPGSVVYDETRIDKQDELAIYGELTWPLSQSLDFTFGGRVARTRIAAQAVVLSPAPGARATFSGKLADTRWAPKAVLAFHPTARTLFYLQAAEGYRSGGFNTSGANGQVFGGPGSGPRPYRKFEGDELWSYEAGVKTSWLEGRLVARAALFQAKWINVQTDEFLDVGLPYTDNLGQGRNKGLELEAIYVTGRLHLGAQLTLNDPERTSAAAGVEGPADSPLDGVSRVSGGVEIHYEHPLKDGLTTAFDARYAYVGPSRLTFHAVAAPSMGDYGAGRAAAALYTDRWRVSVFVDNPANSRGDTFAYGNPFAQGATRQITPQRPITVGMGLELRF